MMSRRNGYARNAMTMAVKPGSNEQDKSNEINRKKINRKKQLQVVNDETQEE
jgi:hypothetical protein